MTSKQRTHKDEGVQTMLVNSAEDLNGQAVDHFKKVLELVEVPVTFVISGAYKVTTKVETLVCAGEASQLTSQWMFKLL